MILAMMDNEVSPRVKAKIDGTFSVGFSALPKLCDFQCNSCFALAKKLGKAPFEIAEEIVKNISENQS